MTYPLEIPESLSAGHDVWTICEELSFTERWTRILAGLKQPRTSGAHRWARTELTRLWSPVSAVTVPILVVLVLTLLARSPKDRPEGTVATIMPEPPPPAKLDKLTPLPDDTPVEPDVDLPMDARLRPSFRTPGVRIPRLDGPPVAHRQTEGRRDVAGILIQGYPWLL